MIPIRDNTESRETPVVTLTLIGLCLIIFLWDRAFRPLGGQILFADLAMRPYEVVLAVRGRGNTAEMGKVFTSLFLHGSLLHLIMNMLFLQAFGPTVERTLGGMRFALYYLFWGVAAAAAQTVVYPRTEAYVLGASGAIGGVMGAYFLLYPSNRITVALFPLVWIQFGIRAAILMGVWFLLQLLLPQEGVANWAHVGGFVAGMMTVLVMGGREKVLKGMMRTEPTLE
jgi:membrane associated rhomboid family serine protease